MQQLARRIRNGHSYMRQEPDALKKQPGSMDLNIEQHAQAGRDYQARYGQMYSRRHGQPVVLPKAVVDWLQELNNEAAQVGFLQALGFGILVWVVGFGAG
jgi:hypothetical protein